MLPGVAMTREDGLDEGEVCDFAWYVIRRGVTGDKCNQFFEESSEMLGEKSDKVVIFKGVVWALITGYGSNIGG